MKLLVQEVCKVKILIDTDKLSAVLTRNSFTNDRKKPSFNQLTQSEGMEYSRSYKCQG